MPPKGNFFPQRLLRQKDLPGGRLPSQNLALAYVREISRSNGHRYWSKKMLRLLDDHPNASLWLIAVAQGAAMLGFNVLLRTLLA